MTITHHPPSISDFPEASYKAPVADITVLKQTCEFLLFAMAMRARDLDIAWTQQGTLLEMSVRPAAGSSPDQLGPLIGKKGRTVAALRRVLQVISLRYGYCVRVVIPDDDAASNTIEEVK